MFEARLTKQAPNGYVDCYLCSFRCHIGDGRRGVCGVRENTAGTLYSLVYGKLIAEHIDPIEKKPLYHFQPASRSYSIATTGCNFKCLHCQNSEISQMPRDQRRIIGDDVSPEEVVHEALNTGCSSISYTYTEPTIFFEFAYDTGVLAKKQGLKNIFVTNGYMTSECLDELRGILDAANVDLKAFSETFYKKTCGATLKPVLESIEYMLKLGIWVEVTTLIIPTMNDSDDELRNIARWLASLSKAIPWHVSAFHPAYKLSHIPSTPGHTLIRARDIGIAEGLRYVYTGNIPNSVGETTFCHGCAEPLIKRVGFAVKDNVIEDGKCPYCKTQIDGIEL
ncbi:MAG: AmmeMemoRadiSam system radical SAM enzyme [Deltaproteobacteria bacterium RIFCSPLOWO2_02_FULL_53_8]|nr:MAG: AmmeMemoRadiSam system radical SAM enzyme [Deltaproteobacteria bacterium RIFCSPLOWO2_02_FULL_53_8]